MAVHSPHIRHFHWHWEPALAMIVTGVAYALVSGNLRQGPRWALPAVVIALLIPLTIARRRGWHLLSRRLAFVLALLAMIAVGSSVGTLVVQLFRGSAIPAKNLLRDAALLWLSNIAVFGIWYWELDGGGPGVRLHHGYKPTDLLFPQNQQGGDLAAGWMPGFVDYLLVAFNASTAFSPTDTLVLSARAKLLMMLQSLSSIVILAILAARAINTLQ
jgi:hypothetical protein